MPDNGDPFLLLGEWCKDYKKEKNPAFFSYEIWPYHWDDRKKMRRDSIEIEEIYKKNISILGHFLNKKNNVKHTSRYWEIVAGPWLKRFLMIAFDRWEILEKCWKGRHFSEVILEEWKKNSSAAKTTHEFVLQTINDKWNNEFFGKMSKYLKIPIKVVKIKSLDEKKRRSFLNEFINNTKENLFSFLATRDKYCFCETYLSRPHQIWLQLLLKQIPKKLSFSKKIKTSLKLRRKNEKISLKGKKNNFLKFLSKILTCYIPKSFLEDYKKTSEVANSYNPKKPKVIFTSNSHCYNDLFKIYSANKIENGSKLVIGQHGGFYGVGSWGSEEKHEIRICDKYLSWGWKSKSSKIIPFGILTHYKANKKISNNKKLLLIQNMTYRYAYYNSSFPVSTSQWSIYFNEQKTFVDNLPNHIFSQTAIRLMPGTQYHDEEVQWKETFPSIRFEKSRKSLPKILQKYGIAVISYQGTPLNELLFNNIPTIAFWNPKQWEIRKCARPIFQKLLHAGILHKTPESASHLIYHIWDNIGNWWAQPQVQTARNEFCKKYAKSEKQPVYKILKILKKLAYEKHSR